ncbi:MAG: SDR family oxidoreductase [Hellea sp.]|nr:SDR family oxidoreductase [Hellea sp.]
MAYNFNDAVAVITGAGSGIGRALAIGLAGQGAHLALSDINQSGLDETAALIGDKVKIRTDLLDVTNRKAMFEYAEMVQAHFGKVNLVFNNAGSALNGEFTRTGLGDFDWQMDVNFGGVLNGTKAFLPILEQAEWGHITNISSIFGIIAAPGNSAYNASKFAVRGLTECLRIELGQAKSTVSCTSVHPGGVKTNVVRNARSARGNTFMGGKTHDEMVKNFDKLARTSPEKAAAIILKGTAKNKKRVLVGTDAKIIDKIQRLFPTVYFPIMVKLFGYGKDLME